MKKVMLNKKKFIFFISTLVVAYLLLIPLTFAAELTKEEKKIEKKCSDDAMEGKYEPKVTDNGDGTLTFSIDPDDNYDNISFDFSTVNPSNAITASGIKKLEKAVLTKDNPITVSLSESGEEAEEIEVIFLNVKKDKDKCINRKIIFGYTPFIAKGGKRGAVRATEELPNIEVNYGFLSEDSDEDTSEVGIRFKELFKKGFIAMLKREDKLSQEDAEKKYASYGDESDLAYKKRVDALIEKHKNAEKPDDLTGTSALKCDYKVKKDEEVSKEEYYTEENTQNFVHAYKEDAITADYTYNYAPNAVVEDKSHKVCNRICVEALEAQYGPPVASKAGFCFEYKVKVRSIVRCHAELADDNPAPEKKNTVCTPSPLCFGSAATATRQAGGNEEFEACINACDGGKYTDSCSNKCYQSVYGKQKSNLSLYTDVDAEKMALDVKSCIAKQKKYSYSNVYSYGCYYWTDDTGRGVAFSKGDDSIKNYGRWFYQTNYNPDYPTYGTLGDGIKRHRYGSSWCTDNCYWIADTCQRDEYLNFGFAADDYKNNMEQYKLAIEECQAKATCTTKTAEFTISANYGDEANPNWVDFPQGYDHDSLTSPADEGSLNTSTNENTTIIDAGDNTCYNNERDNSRQYLTEWTFPGTWIENKTGQMSYDTPPSTDGWYKEKKQFCVRFDAKDVNQKWWNYYMSVKYGEGGYSYQEDTYEDECNNYVSTTTDSKFTKEDLNNINWNLKAITKNFGYFGWNIEMRCFYALNSDPSSDLKSSVDKNSMCDTNLNYRVRSVNNNNLFPASDGASLENKDETGRAPGFNWTSAAKIRYDKTSGGTSTTTGSSSTSETLEELDANGYAIDPATLIKQIQNKGDEIYQDTNCLDYSFHLTPSVLKEIKRDNSVNIKYDYTKFNGEYRYDNGYGYYISDLFRNGSSDSGKEYAKKIPAISQLGRNNNGSCYKGE